MASINYGMGQLRFNSGYSYVTSKKHEGKKEGGFDPVTLVKVPPTATTTAETQCWRDYVMDCEAALGEKLSSDTTYLLKLSIPKDENYDCDFNVKLIDNADSSIGTQATGYQVIRYLHVPAAGGNQKNSRIILYPVIKGTDYQPWSGEGEKADQPRVAIALNYQGLSEQYQTGPYNYDAGTVFYNYESQRSTTGEDPSANSEYAVMESGGESLPTWENINPAWKILNKNDTILNWIWEIEDHSTETVNFNIIFRPKTDIYSRIWVEMSRGSIDWDIFDGISIGRTIDVDSSGNFSAELFTLAELAGTSSSAPLPEGLTNIGLHSHPNLLFAINGEEIRVGQSGYYELNDFDITSFNIAAVNKEDYFVLDYQYKVMS